jgi:ABC-type uncharacterized transport system substrate-binding protein
MIINSVWRIVVAAAIFTLIAMSTPAWAHPHVFIDGREEIIFDDKQQIVAIRNHWTFDEAFSSFASIGMDKDGDGKLSREELAPLAEINATSLKEYDYFTRLLINNKEFPFKDPTDYYLTEDNGRLTLHFILPLVKPVKISEETIVEIFDSEFYIAFEFKNKSASLVNAPVSCTVAHQPPGELDVETISLLASVPPDQRKLPPKLRKVAMKLANLFIIRCPQ